MSTKTTITLVGALLVAVALFALGYYAAGAGTVAAASGAGLLARQRQRNAKARAELDADEEDHELTDSALGAVTDEIDDIEDEIDAVDARRAAGDIEPGGIWGESVRELGDRLPDGDSGGEG